MNENLVLLLQFMGVVVLLWLIGMVIYCVLHDRYMDATQEQRIENWWLEVKLKHEQEQLEKELRNE